MSDPEYDPNEGFGALIFPLIGMALFGCAVLYVILNGCIL